MKLPIVVIQLLMTASLAFAGSPGLLTDLADRAAVIKRLDSGDQQLGSAREALVRSAEAAMEVAVIPITAGKENGERLAPSGDPHDYVSLSPYWWPDPDTRDGLPYIRRDGRVNPERHDYDTPKLGDMGSAVRTLGFAYHITGDERYAERALEHIRAWFVEVETRMNPNVRYAQFVPGVSIGRHVGVIDTNRLRWVPDAMLMLAESPAWTERDTSETKRWFSEYVDWLLTSDLGKAERAATNNHGTWYASQVAYYALYAGREDVTREMVESIPARIASQIEPDGKQPYELERTNALDYSDFNIRAMLDLSRCAERVGVDLAGYETDDGRSIRAALDFIVPYLTGENPWPYEQIKKPKTHMYYQCLRIAARVYDEPRYERAIERLPAPPDDMRWVDVILPSRHAAEKP
ncbi:MAG: alginate lyase family protein [Phycisphaerales bacterium]|nr:alginate lyase family protein [Phycisphaerales bacterium]